MKKTILNMVTVLTIIMIPQLLSAQAPALGSTSDFVLFTSVGAVGNTGISQVTGNVGTNSGSITGFGNVNGVMHSGDLATTLAAADLIIAYNQLNAAIPTFFPAPLLGNGDTLIPGVYRIAAVTTFAGDLFLDAQGDSNAVFIIQIQAAFSANAAAKVKLINGALACHVFWKIEGLVSLAPAVVMRGTIVANNAAINFNTNDTLEGRAFSTAGAITISGTMAYIPTGCGSLVLTGPIAPNLGSVACYAIFSGNGPVTNAGITYVTGDVGTNVGLTTGFNPLFVNGTIHPIPDGSTTAAAADLLSAYSYLNIVPVDIQLLYPAQFGNDLVLTPHTYLLDAATTFTGNVYLNAAGNANAVFLIKINGALSTSTYSKVMLINGAQASNVYWLVEGAASINDYSVFNGTLISNNGAVNLSTGDSINGRALTTNGAVSTASIVATSPSGPCFALGVDWLYFRGQPVNQSVLLEWATTAEVNNQFFTLERSTNGVDFDVLAIINPAAQTGNNDFRYSFTDMQPKQSAYYRISQTDYDGHKSYYRTIQIGNQEDQGLHVTQFMENNMGYLKVTGADAGIANIDIYGVDGKKLHSQQLMLTSDANMIQLDLPAQQGLYLLNMVSNGKVIFKGKMTVQ